MALADRIKELELNPLFKDLSYREQAELRSELFSTEVGKLPEFSQLKPEQQFQLYNEVIFRPPVFEGDVIANSGEYRIFTENINSEDPERRKFAMEWASATVLGNAIGENITLGNIVKGLGMSILGGLTNQNALGDFNKMVEYYDLKLNTDSRFTYISGLKQLLGGITVIADIGSLYATTVGSFTNPKGIVKPLMNIVGKLDRVLPFGGAAKDLALRGLRAAFHSFGGGLVGVVRETTKDWALSREGFQDPEIRDVVSGAMNHFGEYAVGDFIFFGIAGILKRAIPWATQSFTRSSQTLRNFNIFRGLEDDVVSGLLRPKNEAQLQTLIRDAMTGRVPKALFETLDDTTKGIVQSMEALAKARDITKIGEDTILRLVSQSQGYSILEEAGKWKLFDIAEDGKLIGTFSDRAKVTQKLSDLILQDVKVPLTPQEFQTIGAGMKRVEFKEVISANLKGDLKNTPDLLTKLIAPIGGKLEPEQVSGFAKTFLMGNGVDDAIVGSVRSMPVEDGIKLFVGANEVATIPKVVSSPLIEREAIGNIVEGLGKFLPEEAIVNEDLVKNFVKQYETSVAKQQLYTPDWVEMAAREQWQGEVKQAAGGKWEVSTPKGILEFSSMDEIGDAIVKEATTVEILRQHLNQYEGIQLNALADGQLELVKPGMQKTRYADLNELLVKNPELTPRISSILGPELSIVDSTVTGVKYQGKTVVGDYQSILRELDKFKDYSAGSKVRIYSGTDGLIDVNRFANEFTVRLADLNYEQTFKSKEEAIKFLKGGVDSYAKLSLIAESKGLILDTQGTKFILYDQNKQFLFNTIDELKAGLSNIAPSPSFMPEMSGLDSKIFDGIEKNVDFTFQPKSTPYLEGKTKNLGPLWYMNNIFSPPDRQLYSAVKKGAAPKELMEYYNNIEAALRLQTAENFNWLGVADAVFTDPTTHKKMADGIIGTAFTSKWKDIKENLGKVLFEEVPEAEWAKLAKTIGLDEKYLQVGKDVRQVFDSLADFFGVPPEMRIENYFSRVRKFAQSVDLSKYVDTDTAKFLDDAYGGNAPKQLRAFFENARMSDFAQFVTEKDPMIVLTKYIIAGNRKKFLGPAVFEARNWLNANWNKMEKGAATRFAYFLNEVSGIPQVSYNMDNIRNAGEELMNVLNIGPKHARKDFASRLFSLSYLSTMAWRPALMTRNSHQIFTTLASRFGFDNVDNAMRLLADDTTQTIYNRLKANGVLQVDLPLPGAQFMSSTGKLSKIATAGLQGYRSSDELTRAIAYLTAEFRFGEAYKRFQNAGGKMSLETFAKESGMTLMDDITFNKIGQLLNSGNDQGALNLFASTVVRDTMFPYIPGFGGTLSKQSVIGKIFGAYGHYPAWYRANVMRGFTQGTFGQKVAFATRWIGGGLAMASLYGAIGVGAQNFIPWSPMFFNGGPYFDLVHTLLEFPMSELARSEILGGVVTLKNNEFKIDPTRLLESKVVRNLVPTAYQIRAMLKGVDFINQGDMWKAFVALTSAPIVEADPFVNWEKDWLIQRQR